MGLGSSITVYSNGSLSLAPSAPTLARYFTVPASGRFDFITHDYQNDQPNNYKPRKPATQTEVPETVNVRSEGNLEFLPLTRPVAEFYLATFRIANPFMSREEALLRYRELTRRSVCFTDKNAWDYGDLVGDPTKNYADVLNGVNLENRVMAWKISIITAGAVLKKISGSTYEAIDYTEPLPDPVQLYREQPWKFFWATQCYMETTGQMEFLGGRMRPQYKVARFPQFAPVGVLVPLMGAGGRVQVLETWRIREIANGATWSPYVLAA